MRHSIVVRTCAAIGLVVPSLWWPAPPGTSAQEKAAEKELAALQGTWVIVGKEFMGKKASEEEVKMLIGRTVIKGAKITEWDDLSKEIIGEMTFTVDPTAKPKTKDLQAISGPLKGETLLAIYELDRDALKVCYSFGKGEKRPSEFVGKADGKSLFLTYKRQKK